MLFESFDKFDQKKYELSFSETHIFGLTVIITVLLKIQNPRRVLLFLWFLNIINLKSLLSLSDNVQYSAGTPINTTVSKSLRVKTFILGYEQQNILNIINAFYEQINIKREKRTCTLCVGKFEVKATVNQGSEISPRRRVYLVEW